MLVAAAVLAALLAGLDGLDPEPAKAGRGYTYCRAKCQKKRCQRGCKQARRTCIYCVKQDLKPVMAECSRSSGSERKTCRSNVKATTKTAIQQCGGLTGACGQCCKRDYTAGCTDTFSDTSGFGTYFRTYRRYGQVRRYRPTCEGGAPIGGGDPAACRKRCERTRALELKRCGKRGCDTAEIDARLSACVAGCDGVTTTTTLPQSPSSAFLHP